MDVFTAGQVALLPFPFSDLSRNKLRPAVLLAGASREDWIVCQITSNPFGDNRSLPHTVGLLSRNATAHQLCAPR